MVTLHALIPSLFAYALSACMLWVVISDAVRYVIPNSVNGLLVALYVLAVFFLPVHPTTALAVALAVLAVGLLFFTLGLMGGGDIKLLVALSLWTGWGMATVQFIFLTAICGGLLVVVVLLLRGVLAPVWSTLRPTRTLPRLLRRKQPVPYGIAIAAAFSWMLWTGGIAAFH